MNTTKSVYGKLKIFEFFDKFRGINQLNSTFGDEVPSKASVQCWFNESNHGYYLLTDEFKGHYNLTVVAESTNARPVLIINSGS